MRFAKALERFAPVQSKADAASIMSPYSSSFAPPSNYSAQHSGRVADTYADAHFVYEIVHDVASSASVLPLKVYTIDAKTAEREESLTHPAYRLLRNPNGAQDAILVLEYLFANRLLHGEWFLYKERTGRRVTALWPLRPDRLTEVPNPDTGKLMGWMLDVGRGQREPLLGEDVIHNRSYHPSNDYRGMSPIQALRYQVELGKDAEDTAVEFFANSAITRQVLKVNKRAGGESLKRLAREFRELLVGAGRRYKIPVLEEGMDLQSVQLGPAEADWLGTANITRERVAEAYSYPLPSQYQGTTPEDIRRAKYASAVQPLCVSMEAALETHLMDEFSPPAFPEFKLDHILDADFPTLVEALQKAVYGGFMAPDEAARKLNLPPDPSGAGSHRLVPLNLEFLSNIAGGNEVPRPADSNDGMGGDEGRTGSSTGRNAAMQPRATKDAARSYGRMRERRLSKLSKALQNRLVGVLKRESSAIRDGKAARTDLPSMQELEQIIGRTDPEVAKLLHQFNEQAGAAGMADAQTFGTASVDPARFATLFEQRAQATAAAFGEQRASWLTDLLADVQSGTLDQRGFMTAVADGYKMQWVSQAERVARTEVAYAHEAMAQAVWSDLGAVGSISNFGGGPCSTGVCEEADGLPMTDGSEIPYHNSCGCYSTPDFGPGLGDGRDL